MSSSKLLRSLTIGAAVGLCLLAAVAVGLRRNIQSGLDHWAGVAQAAHPHPGDDVAALMDFVQSASHPLHERNRAIWALGQARDERAEPVLAALYQGGECDHEHELCQRGLRKALALCRGEGPNLLCIGPPATDRVDSQR